MGFPGGSDGKESASDAGDLGSIPESGRFPWEGNGNPLEYSCLENPMDSGAWEDSRLGDRRVGRAWATAAFTLDSMCKWHQVSVFLLSYFA